MMTICQVYLSCNCLLATKINTDDGLKKGAEGVVLKLSEQTGCGFARAERGRDEGPCPILN
jgi:hypothetical protein